MKIAVGMSGGADSTYAAFSLLNEGHSVEGVVLKMHRYTDIDSARAAAEKIGIPFHIIECESMFEEKVEKYFAKEYLAGRTPNPCIFCNREIKFEKLADFADENGFDMIATGHYAAIGQENGRYFIKKSPSSKDQSYMLCRLSQRQLSKIMFPVGELEKEYLRDRSREANLPSADKKDSQEICFIPDGDYKSFVEQKYGKSKPGRFIAPDGDFAGNHSGILRYTVGQRKGLGLSLGKPHYISRIDSETGDIFLSDSEKSGVSSLIADRLVFQAASEDEIIENQAFGVKIRYSSAMSESTVSIRNGKAYANFEEPVRAVTPGQSAVFYRDSKICFSGFIV